MILKKKEMISDWKNDSYLSLAFVHGGTPRHSRESDYLGFQGKKKTSTASYAPLCHADHTLACHTTFLISMNIF